MVCKKGYGVTGNKPRNHLLLRLLSSPFLDSREGSRAETHSAARLERGEINEKRLGGPPLVHSTFRLFRAPSRLSRKGLLAVYLLLGASITKKATVLRLKETDA